MNNGIQYINGFHPVDTYFNGKQIAGSVPKVVSGDGHVEWESPYNALKEVKLLGKSEQQTFSGRNIYNMDWVAAAYTPAGAAQTAWYGYVDGKELVANMGLYNDAYVWWDGVHTIDLSVGIWRVSAEFWFPTTCTSRTVAFNFLKTETKSWMTRQNVVTNAPDETWTKASTVWTVTEANADTYKKLAIMAQPHGTSSQLFNLGVRVRNIQISKVEKSTDDPAFEPYCGGIPSPNPDYPQEVKGNNGVFVCGDSQAVAPELYAIGDYKDEWNPQTGKGLRRIGKVELKGGGYWSATGTRVFTSDVILSNALPHTNMNTVANILCSHYEAVTHGITFYNSKIGISYYSGTLSFSFGTGTTYTVAEWTEHLKELYDAGTPITIYYALAEPVPFETEPMPLTCPVGYGQLIQLDGNIADCPVEVTYLESMG